MDVKEQNGRDWTLLTGHRHVLIVVTGNARARISCIVAAAGIGEHINHSFRCSAQDGHRFGPFREPLAGSADPLQAGSWP